MEEGGGGGRAKRAQKKEGVGAPRERTRAHASARERKKRSLVAREQSGQEKQVVGARAKEVVGAREEVAQEKGLLASVVGVGRWRAPLFPPAPLARLLASVVGAPLPLDLFALAREGGGVPCLR